MNKLVKYLLVGLIAVSFLSCIEEEPDGGGGYVRFRLDLGSTGQDRELNAVYASKRFTSPRLGSEQVGIAGLLVVNIGFDDSGYPQLNAFDLCCPCSARYTATVEIKSDDNQKIICTSCNSEFNLGGRVISGSAKRKLYTYKVSPRLPYDGYFDISN